ncbi:MAG: alpha-E domain-containing protein [Acidimicrobiales bacterium]
MLLSRTAENLYWLGRHLERAEAVSRIIREHTKLLVDLPVDVESDWAGLLAITGADESYSSRYAQADEVGIVSHLMADIGNPTSVIRTVAAARENLRVTRQLMPASLWECVNVLHATVSTSAGNCTARSSRLDLASGIISSSQQIVGILASTVSRDDAFSFYELGRNVERADMTTRVLDVRAASLLSDGAKGAMPPADRSPYEDVRWMGVLRSLGAMHMYNRCATGSIRGESVVDFLVDDDRFPRSVNHCLLRVDQILAALPARSLPADRAGRLRRIVSDRSGTTFDAQALHDWVDEVQVGIEALHGSLAGTFFTPETTKALHPSGRVVV